MGKVTPIPFNGTPQHGEDLALPTDDSYATVVTATKSCTHLMAWCETHDVMLSLDGGTTDHLAILAGQVHTFDGLDIALGAVIQGKNLVAAEDAVRLHVMIW
jgi:hypothetical protein